MTDLQNAPRSPQELISQMGRCIAERNLDRLMALYEDEAVFVPEPGVQLRGREAIQSGLAGMLSLSPSMETRVLESHEVGELALILVEWSLRGTAPDGTAVTQGGRSTDVLRRQSDGTWRVLIDHP